jgi:mannose-6-phosphate isomerase-like protein (cupin superfamily)
MQQAALAALILAAGTVLAQTQEQPHGAVKTPATGGNSYAGPGDIVYPPVRDPLEERVDLFINDWHNSLPRTEFGSLVLRDILTPGDNYSPPEKGAVLQGANFLSYGRLAPGYVTTPSKMEGRQEVFYILGGKGEITAGGRTEPLHQDIAVLMPEGLEFTMKNSGDDDLTMYVIDEPTPKGFKPKTQMVAVNERTVVVRTPMEGSPYTLPGASGHWAHVVRDLFNRQDGMATVGDVITVEINPLSMGEPHPHGTNHEEVWVAIDGDSLALIGNELRVQKPGMAYMLRPDNIEVHSNINYGDKPVKFLWFSGPSVRK